MKKTIFLLLIFGLLTWINFKMFDEAVPVDPIYSANVGLDIKKSVTVSPKIDEEIDEFTETYARPLFSITRRPYVPTVEVEKTVAEIKPVDNLPKASPTKKVDRPQLLVKGIAAGPRGAKALVENLHTSKANWVGVDDLIGDWRVTRIDLGKITLSYEAQDFSIELYPPNILKVRTE